MPSLIVTASTTAQSVAAAVRNGVHEPTSMTIDNEAGSADRTIRIQDVFTPDVTNGTASPSETTVDRGRWDVPQGDSLVLSEQDLKGIKCLGALKIIGDAVDANCHISVGYKTE
ncbi:hypothetical protein LCGC14_1481950 [marine sediment metagenome]|uniref:Uncharacterized protein n=1 Tax=marine sediment metagenome TaxID=412755 RepID=A0A0F9LPU3_9ZZZZ